MIDQRIVVTFAVIGVAVAFRIAVGGIFERKFQELVGHQLLANSLTGIFTVGLIFYLLYIWGVIQALAETLAALGLIAAVIVFTVKDIWISNLFAGISLIGDKLINIGSEVEIGNKRGKIVEMTLTVTKIRTADGSTVIVPNKKFREDVIVVRTKRY